MGEIVYLAGPYSRGTEATRLARFHALTHAAAKLINMERVVYSPITMTHPIDLVLADNGRTLGSEFWVGFDETFMNLCSAIAVLTLPGWRESSGVSREIAHFAARGVTPDYLSPEDLGITREIPLFLAAFTLE